MSGPDPVPLACPEVLGGEWEHVATRSYGTTIHRVRGDRTYYVKTSPIVDTADLRFHPENEAARLRWLARMGFPVPEVVEVGGTAERSWLVTTAVTGMPAAGPWSPAERARVVGAVAELAAALHALPERACPFDRTLAVTLPRCRAAVRLGTVDLDDIEEHRRGWSAERLLAELDATPVPPEDDIVVCHGDLCLDNVLLDPETLTVTGVLDTGRLGRADRWLDLSVAMRDIGEERQEWGFGPAHATLFRARYGLSGMDYAKRDYYRLLDEFI
ncbi:APH(3') family aminoglycoside O-phosphotransferase [Amycolatopsis aidingensis]|uniref:APH(3') family aminoglycoside O-phosphotransferase n=1 Tax=Amycolatopsis aidingensis TaxID=2842453 RepID=UPI001C0C7F2B|nr:APH(3') family aminoglycoside O-phosphotransferase [Amycolatopsis aidingensis]